MWLPLEAINLIFFKIVQGYFGSDWTSVQWLKFLKKEENWCTKLMPGIDEFKASLGYTIRWEREREKRKGKGVRVCVFLIQWTPRIAGDHKELSRDQKESSLLSERLCSSWNTLQWHVYSELCLSVWNTSYQCWKSAK